MEQTRTINISINICFFYLIVKPFQFKINSKNYLFGYLWLFMVIHGLFLFIWYDIIVQT